jgi:hypothetical protein
MAHKKGEGSSKNGRDSNSQRLGVKIFGGQAAIREILLFVSAAQSSGLAKGLTLVETTRFLQK